MDQFLDLQGVADYLGYKSLTPVKRRIEQGTFVLPTDPNTITGPWWKVEEIDRWKKQQSRKKRKTTTRRKAK